MDYPIVILPITPADGGGFLAIVPDLMGCMSDGETQEEALANGREAAREWIETAQRRGIAVPEPGSFAKRDRVRHEQIIAQLKSLASSVDDIDSRLQGLESAIRDVEEHQANSDAWSRLADITGFGAEENPPPSHIGSC